jgi:CheY-like chemotaxis protein
MPQTILNVSDDLVGRYLFHAVLENACFEILEASSGAEAFRLAPRASLILLDVDLPDMSGYEVCRQLKADAATRLIPIIQMSSSFHDAEKLKQGKQGGADLALPRQVPAETLLATIHSLIAED